MRPDAPTESGSSRDGLLSYAKEWHALILGLAAGLMTAVTGRPVFAVTVVGIALAIRAAPVGRLRQVRREPWYAVGGVVLGFAGGAAVVALGVV